MFCCLGLLAGFAVGSILGGPWMFIAPAAGFGLGLIGDRRIMRSHGGFGGSCCGGGHVHNKKGVKDSVYDLKVDEKTKDMVEFEEET